MGVYPKTGWISRKLREESLKGFHAREYLNGYPGQSSSWERGLCPVLCILDFSPRKYRKKKWGMRSIGLASVGNTHCCYSLPAEGRLHPLTFLGSYSGACFKTGVEHQILYIRLLWLSSWDIVLTLHTPNFSFMARCAHVPCCVSRRLYVWITILYLHKYQYLPMTSGFDLLPWSLTLGYP